MTSISLGGGHCCACSGVCHHIGGPFLCHRHAGIQDQPAPPPPIITTPGVPIYTPPTPAEPCGALVVLEWWEGAERSIRWCDRRSGPCPFVGAETSKASARPCAVTTNDQNGTEEQGP